jgi:hypothetical protein
MVSGPKQHWCDGLNIGFAHRLSLRIPESDGKNDIPRAERYYEGGHAEHGDQSSVDPPAKQPDQQARGECEKDGHLIQISGAAHYHR